MKKTMLLLLLLPVIFSNCNDNSDTESVRDEKVEIPINGRYSWQFTIPEVNAEQISIHHFTNDNIRYEMTGSAYSNSYDMMPIHYSNNDGRLVTVGKGGSDDYNKEGIYFVMFLKDIQEKEVTLYKKECASKEEAFSFPKPPDNDTNNHGWNVYTKE